MKIGIFAKTFPGTTPEAVMAASAAAGFQGVQYNMACSGLNPLPEHIDRATAEAVREAARRHGLQIFALSATWNMAHPDAAVRQQGLRAFAALAPAARAMGTRLLTLCTGSRDPLDQWRAHPDNTSPEAWADMRASFAAALRIAEDHDVLLGVEPELANVISTARAARRLIDEMRSDRIRIVLDPANQFETATPDAQRGLVEEAVDLLGERIVMAHAKDRAKDGGFATAGKGVVDFAHLLSTLHAAGFDGPVVTHGLAASEAAGVAHFLQTRLADL